MKPNPLARWSLRAVVAPALVATLLTAGLSGAALAQSTPAPELGGMVKLINCVDPSFPPMEYYEDQNAKEPIGFDIDLTNEIAKRLGLEAEIVPTEFTGLLPGLAAGRCDIVASGLYLTAERLAAFDAQPYYDTAVVLITLADNDSITSPEDLSGKTVAVQAGTNYINVLNDLQAKLEAEGKPLMTIQTYPKQTDAIQQLVVGRADATISQDTEQAFREKAQPGVFKIAFTYPDTQTFGVYYRPDEAALGAALKQTIEAMRDDGTIAAIAKKWNLPESGANYTGHIYNPDEENATPAATPTA
ncbi:MAG: ABC transporter substrate-binding protein [Thermomicrobiales bacterium]|nr:ABC transporter substrate-binding protein [Thermomicrobiales bacterium]